MTKKRDVFAKRNVFAKYRSTIALENNEDGVFVTLDGVKVAKRGTRNWILLRQGYTVTDSDCGNQVEVRYNGVKIYHR